MAWRGIGDDGTDGFDDVGHSAEAVNMLKDYLVGDIAADEVRERAAGGASADAWCTIL